MPVYTFQTFLFPVKEKARAIPILMEGPHSRACQVSSGASRGLVRGSGQHRAWGLMGRLPWGVTVSVAPEAWTEPGSWGEQGGLPPGSFSPGASDNELFVNSPWQSWPYLGLCWCRVTSGETGTPREIQEGDSPVLRAPAPSPSLCPPQPGQVGIPGGPGTVLFPGTHLQRGPSLPEALGSDSYTLTHMLWGQQGQWPQHSWGALAKSGS